VAVDPSGHYAIVANQTAGNLSVYAINASTGALTAVSGSPFGTNLAPFSLAFGAGGKFVYASTASGTSFLVSGFALNAASGALTALAPALTAPVDNYVSTDPSGAYLYATVGSTVAVYAIDQTTGALTAVSGSPYAAGVNAYSAATDPARKFLYVGNDGADTVSAYTIDATTGTLTAVPGSPFAAGSLPDFITVL
jgi:6-phosphogluconolactonase (cycloisomerase 2 family)